MTHTGRASRLLPLLFFILTLNLSTSASRIQAATGVTSLPWHAHAGNLSPSVVGTVTEYPIPTPGSQPVGITSNSIDGNLWFTESTGNKIGKMTTSGQITEYPLPAPASPATAEPEGITSDSNGNLWFTEFSPIYGNKIGKMTTSGQVTLYPLPAAGSEPDNITLGSCGDGSQCLWFTEFNNDKIGKITTDGQITEYTIPTTDREPEGITNGPDGNLWFTEYNASNIGRITPSGQINEYGIPGQTPTAQGIIAGPDGKLWFTIVIAPDPLEGSPSSSRIGQIDPSTLQITESAPLLNPGCLPNGMALGSDGRLWFTEYYQIGAVTTGDSFTDYPLPTGSNSNLPDQITAGPDNNLWFTEFSGNNIGRITTS